MEHEIVVVDYHKGNLQSVARSIAAAAPSVDVAISDDPQDILDAGGIILPGVGAFEDAMDFLRQSGQADALREALLKRSTPFLGICLGLHLLFSRGDERSSAVEADAATKGPSRSEAAPQAPAFLDEEDERDRWVAGLGILRGSVTRLESERLKVPHVGWDQLHFTEAGRRCPLFVDVAEGANVYFTHSYAVADDAGEDIVCARTHYVRSFPSAVWKDNVYGVQFHPEKSSQTGLAILGNFVRIVRG